MTQLEIMPMPPEKENKALSWPHWPLKLRVSSSQAEGAKVEYSISTTGFAGKNGKVEKLHYTRVDSDLKPVPGSEGELPADLVLFAMGFSGPVETDVVKELELPRRAARPLQGPRRQRDATTASRAARSCSPPATSAAARALVVWAIREGRQAAARHRPLPDGQNRPAALAGRLFTCKAPDGFAVPFGWRFSCRRLVEA